MCVLGGGCSCIGCLYLLSDVLVDVGVSIGGYVDNSMRGCVAGS